MVRELNEERDPVQAESIETNRQENDNPATNADASIGDDYPDIDWAGMDLHDPVFRYLGREQNA